MRHIRIEGSCSRERLRAAASVGLPELMPPVDAHRRLRGPYTAAGTILRGLIPGLLQRQPELVQRHDIEVLSASPELREAVQATRKALTPVAVEERATLLRRLCGVVSRARFGPDRWEILRETLRLLPDPYRV